MITINVIVMQQDLTNCWTPIVRPKFPVKVCWTYLCDKMDAQNFLFLFWQVDSVCYCAIKKQKKEKISFDQSKWKNFSGVAEAEKNFGSLE